MVSRITAMMIRANDGLIIDTPERSEYWIVKEGRPHARMLSCPPAKRGDMERAVAEIKGLPDEAIL